MRRSGVLWALGLAPVCFVALSSPSTASAQPLRAAVSTQTSTAVVPTVPRPAARLKPAWAAIAAAFEAHLAGDRAGARQCLRLLLTQQAGSPEAEAAEMMLSKFDQTEADSDDRFGTRSPTNLARAELALFQTVTGMAAGGFVCAAGDCDDSRRAVAFIAVGGTVGLAASLGLTHNGISPGKASAINSGTMWGIWNGLAFATALEGVEVEGVWTAMAVGQLLGVGAAVGSAMYFDPRAGDVAFSTSLGMWSTAATTLAIGVSGTEFSQAALFTTLLLASDLGLATGAVLTRLGVVQMSRGRSLIIDSGGAVGLLVGLGVPVLVQGRNSDERRVFAGGLIGLLGGLALTTYLTRHWDAPETGLSLGIRTVDHGAVALIGGDF